MRWRSDIDKWIQLKSNKYRFGGQSCNGLDLASRIQYEAIYGVNGSFLSGLIKASLRSEVMHGDIVLCPQIRLLFGEDSVSRFIMSFLTQRYHGIESVGKLHNICDSLLTPFGKTEIGWFDEVLLLTMSSYDDVYDLVERHATVSDYTFCDTYGNRLRIEFSKKLPVPHRHWMDCKTDAVVLKLFTSNIFVECPKPRRLAEFVLRVYDAHLEQHCDGISSITTYNPLEILDTFKPYVQFDCAESIAYKLLRSAIKSQNVAPVLQRCAKQHNNIDVSQPKDQFYSFVMYRGG